MKVSKFTYLFLVLGVVNILAQYLDSSTLNYITKPLLMPSLLLAAWDQGLNRKGKLQKLIITALGFSWLGDTLLLFQATPIYFMLGLGAFLIAHVFYILSFNTARIKKSEEGHRRRQFVSAVIITIYAILMIIAVYPNLQGMKIPVILYAAVISIMLWSAINRYGRTLNESYKVVVWGAILFLISDSFIAVNKFYTAVSFSGVWIMLTYIIAQYMIVRGLTDHIQSTPE